MYTKTFIFFLNFSTKKREQQGISNAAMKEELVPDLPLSPVTNQNTVQNISNCFQTVDNMAVQNCNP